IPCAFISGITGSFFRQFAMTVAVSTVISAFNSLTLSPALTALLLRPHDKTVEPPLPRLAFPILAGWAAWHFLTPSVEQGLKRLQVLAPDAVPAALVAELPLVAVILTVTLGALTGWLVGGWLNQLLGWLFGNFHRLFTYTTGVYARAVG